MIKKYKGTLIITSLITISPILIGLLLWKRLPEEIATHFGNNNTADGWSSKPAAVFGLPLFMLAIHLFCVFLTANDPKRKNINDKSVKLIFWIIPVVSLVTNLSCYGIALGYQVNIGMIVSILVGILFIVIGNYMHKIKQNYTIGIKISWTLNSEENWNRTHHLASWLWILCGAIMILNSVLQIPFLIFILIFIMTFVPIGYSFFLFKKGI